MATDKGVVLISNETEPGVEGLLRRDAAQQGIKLASKQTLRSDRDDGVPIGVQYLHERDVPRNRRQTKFEQLSLSASYCLHIMAQTSICYRQLIQNLPTSMRDECAITLLSCSKLPQRARTTACHLQKGVPVTSEVACVLPAYEPLAPHV